MRIRSILMLLVLIGTTLAVVPARARIVQSEAPPPSPAERGGEPVSRGARSAARVCSWPVRLNLAAAMAFDACLGMQTAEFVARLTAPARLWAEAERAAWRAPRLSAREAARRAIEQRRRDKQDH